MSEPAAASTTALLLSQWLTPAFPTGAFAYSHGLETALRNGAVTDAPALERWLSDLLRFGAGWQDAVLLAEGLRPGAELDTLDARARALQPSSERLTESAEQGAAFARMVTQVTARALPARCLPLAVAEAVRPLNADPAQVIALYLQGFVTNLATVAMRAMPLGQGEGHAVLARLWPLVAALSARAAGSTLDDLGSAAFGADMAAMEHETLDVRIYRT
ncbi:MAG: urease accessory protein UreF [Rhodobacteraceae bacterium]|nr:urease accessory protein UreF [Paracoccaceae bacterium]